MDYQLGEEDEFELDEGGAPDEFIVEDPTEDLPDDPSVPAHAAPEHMDVIAGAREQLKTTHDVLLDVIGTVTTVGITFGSKDEAVARYMEDVTSALQLLALECERNPLRLMLGSLRWQVEHGTPRSTIARTIMDWRLMLDEFESNILANVEDV